MPNAEDCKKLEDNISIFNSLMIDVNAIIEKLNNQLEKKSVDKIETQVIELKRNTEQSIEQLNKIKKFVPASMSMIGIGTVIIILQIISMFVK